MKRNNYIINTRETKYSELAVIPNRQIKKLRNLYKKISDIYSEIMADIKLVEGDAWCIILCVIILIKC